MSYDIYIGEAVPGGGEWGLTRFVEPLAIEEAPAFPGDLRTGHSNHRHLGYVQMEAFAKNAGIWLMFFHMNDGLMRDHPDTQPLTLAHLGIIRNAIEVWRAHHPLLEPGWCTCRSCQLYRDPKNIEPHVERDTHLARLLWLEFWIDWALKNCKHPALHNR